MSQQTNITDAIQQHFAALTSGGFKNFALFSCFVDGQPAAAIVTITKNDNEYLIKPLFVSVTDAMVLTDHDGNPA
jgi:hypothetical protein